MPDLLTGNSPIAAIIAFFIVLIPLILIHELGHFLAAKAVGITVLEFGIGFPPRIVKLFTWGETEFTLNWIQLGGFVRPLGEDMIRPVDPETVERERAALKHGDVIAGSEDDEIHTLRIRNPKAVNEVKPLGRIFFMAAGALANFATAFLLFAIIALMGLPQAIGGSVFVLDVTPESLFAEAGLQPNDIILEAGGEKFANSPAFLNTIYRSDKPIILTVQRGQPAEKLEIVLPPFDQGELTLKHYTLISAVVEESPAGEAGIQPGDIVIAFNGELIDGMDDFRARTQAQVGQKINLTLRRANETVEVSLVPRQNPPEGQGAIGIGIRPWSEDVASGLAFQEGFPQEIMVPQPLDKAIQYGIERVTSVISMTVQIPSQIISGAISAEDARPVSVVGMSQIGAVMIEESIQQGRVAPIVEFIAVISVALGFFNLLPIPALDGGRILFVLIEIVRGRPIAPEREGIVHLVGLALLLSLSVLVILNDVINPITNILR